MKPESLYSSLIYRTKAFPKISRVDFLYLGMFLSNTPFLFLLCFSRVLVREGRNGIFFRSGNPSDLAWKLGFLFSQSNPVGRSPGHTEFRIIGVGCDTSTSAFFLFICLPFRLKLFWEFYNIFSSMTVLLIL